MTQCAERLSTVSALSALALSTKPSFYFTVGVFADICLAVVRETLCGSVSDAERRRCTQQYILRFASQLSADAFKELKRMCSAGSFQSLLVVSFVIVHRT